MITNNFSILLSDNQHTDPEKEHEKVRDSPMIIKKTIINKEQLCPPPSRYGSVAEFLGKPNSKGFFNR
jgi:hypothetical protein